MSNKDNEIVLLGQAHRTAGLLNVGHRHYVLASRIVAILESGAAPMKRLRERATKTDLLLDATSGRKTRSLVITDSRHVVLSALSAATLQERLSGEQSKTAVDSAGLEFREGEFFS